MPIHLATLNMSQFSRYIYYEVTADICLDADRLDLYRVGITPDPKLMASEIGKRYAELSYEELTKKAKI